MIQIQPIDDIGQARRSFARARFAVLLLISQWATGPGQAQESRPISPTAKSGTWATKYLILTERADQITVGGRLEFEQGFSLIGRGSINADTVFLDGKLYPGYERPNPKFPGSGDKDPIGTFTFGGDLRLGARAIIDIDVRNPRKHDLLVVRGTAKLAGTLRVQFLGYQPKPGDRIPIVRAGKILGGFSRVELPGRGRYQVVFVSNGGNGYLRIGRGGRG